MRKIFLLFLGLFFLCTGMVLASTFENITIPDLNSENSTWHNDIEDEEVEPGMAHGQSWDLEGFFLNGTKLSLVGGYNFKSGFEGTTSGDIFIDVTPTHDAVYGGSGVSSDANKSVNKNYGYDYVLDLDWENNTYDVYALGATSWVKTAYYSQNQGSSPWQYDKGGKAVDGYMGKSLTYNANTAAYNAVFSGGLHNELIVDLGFLPEHTNFIAHYTMGCGNDNIMGQGTIPNPEPATMLLMGFGLIGVAGLGRKKLS